jgi:6-phosphogluconolactonase
VKLTRRELVLTTSISSLSAEAAPKGLWLYVGAYTSDRNKGITAVRFDPGSGELSAMKLAAETPNPTFLELHPSGKYLYAVNEISNYEGQRAGSVTAFSVKRESGELTLLNRLTTKGPGPCHIGLDRNGKMAMVANYGGGSVASYAVEGNGSLKGPVSFIQHEGKGPNTKRQERAHAHSINAAPGNRFAVACDLGTDEIRVYAMDPKAATLKQHSVTKAAPGSGPRHFAFHPNGRYGYAVNELLSTVTVYTWDRKAGTLSDVQTISTLPEDFKGSTTTAEVRVHPTGRFLYASNRGHDSIAVFSVDPISGRLVAVEQVSVQGRTPRNFHIEATGRWLIAANQQTNNLIVFEVDMATGRLRTTGKGIVVGAPVCLRTLPG